MFHHSAEDQKAETGKIGTPATQEAEELDEQPHKTASILGAKFPPYCSPFSVWVVDLST
jgi:hypothetical protein